MYTHFNQVIYAIKLDTLVINTSNIYSVLRVEKEQIQTE